MQDANTHILKHATENIATVSRKMVSSPIFFFFFLEESISLHTVQLLPSRKAFLQLTGMQFEVTGDDLFYFCKDLLNLLSRAGIILTQVQSVDKFTLFRGKKTLPFHIGHCFGELSE